MLFHHKSLWTDVTLFVLKSLFTILSFEWFLSLMKFEVNVFIPSWVSGNFEIFAPPWSYFPCKKPPVLLIDLCTKYLYREGYSIVWKAIGIDTYRHIIGTSILQKSSGLRDIDSSSGGVCGAFLWPQWFQKEFDVFLSIFLLNHSIKWVWMAVDCKLQLVHFWKLYIFICVSSRQVWLFLKSSIPTGARTYLT